MHFGNQDYFGELFKSSVVVDKRGAVVSVTITRLAQPEDSIINKPCSNDTRDIHSVSGGLGDALRIQEEDG